MPSGLINFGPSQAGGDAAIAGAPPLAINVLVDGAGAVRRRPGISSWSSFPSTIPEARSVEGMHSFGSDLYYVNDFRRIRKLVVSTGTDTAMSDATAASQLAGTSRPMFAETPFRLVIAGGAAPEEIATSATLATRLGGSPPNSTHVVSLASRLFSDDTTDATTTGRVRFSETGNAGEETWDALRYQTAEADPDAVTAIRSNSNELWAWGPRSLQVFSPDPISVIAPGRSQPLGCLAPYSVVRSDESFAWLDNQRRIVLSDGRGYEEISAPIAATLDALTTVSDCYAFRVNMGQFDCLAWVFPSDGRTFVYQAGAGWSQWHGWTNGIGHTLLGIKSHFFWSEQSVHLVGLSTGQIAKFDTSAATDLGSTIKAESWSGFNSYGTDAIKHCESVRVTAQRGPTAAGKVALLSWRDDYGAFCTPMRISLGATGDYTSTVELRSLGTYRQRQWKLEMTDAVDMVIARVEETYSAGAN